MRGQHPQPPTEPSAVLAMSKLIPIWVPGTSSAHRRLLLPSSAVVGLPMSQMLASADGVEDDRIVIYYEGNRFGSATMKTFADRCRVAAGRLAADRDAGGVGTSTSAVAWVRREELIRVGLFDPEEVLVTIGDAGAAVVLSDWLGVERLDPSELRRG